MFLLRVVLSLLFALAPCVAFAQEELEPEEPPDPAVIEAAVAAVLAGNLEAFDPDPDSAVTADDPNVDLEILRLQLVPLPLDELENELEAWRQLLEERSRAHSAARIRLLSENQKREQQEASGETQPTDADAPAGETGLDPTRQALVTAAGELRDARVQTADRFMLVVEAYRAKGGDEEVIDEFSQYASALAEVSVDVSDTETAMEGVRGWLFSDHGGLRLLKKAGLFVLALLLSVLLGRLLGAGVHAALEKTGASNELVRGFVRTWIRRISLLLGGLWGLSLIDVNVTPLLAALGAAGFVFAFALQNSLSNFASGMLIVFQKPFDVGDSIEAAGIAGTVKKVTLFSTYLSTEENKQVIVPNNMIWEDVVVNATGTPTRRLSIEFEVDGTHELEEVRETLLDEMRAHPEVFDDPSPEVKLTHIGSEGMTFVCLPWVPTVKRDQVRSDLVAIVGKKLNLVRGATKAAGA